MSSESDPGTEERTPLLRGRVRTTKPAIITNCNDITFDSVIARLYLNPCLLHQEETTRVPKDLELPPTVKAIRNIISWNLANGATAGEPLFESFHGGELSLCGSVAEGTKVGGADEFDFQYLLTVEGLYVASKRLLRTKPCAANRESHSFFSLHLDEQEIMASSIQDRFLNVVRELLQQIIDDFEIKKAGPAVKISYKDDKERTIKIDLTLGLRAADERIEHVLTPLAIDLDREGRFKCHYVAAHDYWKICFVDTEQDLLREITEDDEIKGAVYRIIKLLRDEADIKDPYGDGILPSYPIKVTFLDIAHQDHTRGIKWSIQDITFHVIRILREVECRGLNRSLCNLFLEGDDVMSEADRSYLESRRLLKELKAKERFYVSLRCRQVCFMTLLAINVFSLLVLNRISDEGSESIFGDTRVFRLFANGFYPIICTILCLDSLQLWIIKAERVFILYPFWPLSCLCSILFQQIPQYVAGMLKLDTPVEHNLWRVYDFSSFFLFVIIYGIVFWHSCRGFYERKSFLVLDASALYLNTICPYKWKSPSGNIKTYTPEIGDFNKKIRTVYFLSIFLSSLTLILSGFVFVILIGVNFNWFSDSESTIIDIIDGKDSARAICIAIIPVAVICVIFSLSMISYISQRKSLIKYAQGNL
ncbi:uncharacterized protein LOC135487991 [Lineus longissimus]|uniref:uncharacterized protein LOC135487991 n=1 Tax=Lineus longissimus TaxID=88925 RepID=UPI00315CB5D4